MSKKYKSDVLKAVHENMKGLRRIGLVDKKTMREFDASCLTETKKPSPRQITRLRQKKMSAKQ